MSGMASVDQQCMPYADAIARTQFCLRGVIETLLVLGGCSGYFGYMGSVWSWSEWEELVKMVILQHMGRGPYILVAFEQPGLHRRVFWGGGGGLRDRTLSDNVFNASHNHLSLLNIKLFSV